MSDHLKAIQQARETFDCTCPTCVRYIAFCLAEAEQTGSGGGWIPPAGCLKAVRRAAKRRKQEESPR